MMMMMPAFAPIQQAVLLIIVLCSSIQTSVSQEAVNPTESASIKTIELAEATTTPPRRQLLFDVIEDWLELFNKECPPAGFDALKDFDLESYTSARWYVQRQIPVAYLPLDRFYCTSAQYTIDNNFCFLCNKKPRVRIANRSRQGSVDGDQTGEPEDSTGSPFFRGIIRNPEKEPAKVSVGFLADYLVFNSNYWIVAAGTYADAVRGDPVPSSTVYEYAIITGGSPDQRGAGGKCLPTPGILNFRGMWLFTRDQVPTEENLVAIEALADSMGLDTTAWLPVAQDGCT